jgi:hypothetical protein
MNPSGGNMTLEKLISVMPETAMFHNVSFVNVVSALATEHNANRDTINNRNFVFIFGPLLVD